jgi:flagellar biosynthesis protein FlhA
MSIDADMNIGIIDEQEAQRRRKDIEKEGNFYGAMDGASKFVKGDAIAGIIIILIDIIGGLTIGIAQLGMSWDQALHTYTLLTVGDGIVTQIPALIISTATGIIVTRAASDEVLSKEVARQITAYPKTLLLIAGGLFLVMLLPGIPAWPVLLVLAAIGMIAYYAYRAKWRDAANQAAAPRAEASENLYDLMQVEPVVLEVGSDLVPMVNGSAAFMDRIVAFRKQYARDAGIIVPKVKVTDDAQLAANEYRISVHGAKVGRSQLHIGRMLALSPDGTKPLPAGIETREPAYGLPAVWLDEAAAQSARDENYTLVDAETVLITHLSEIFKKHAPELLSRKETEALVEQVRKRDRTLVEELVPAVLTLSDVQKVLQHLLREEVSIRSIDLILEALLEQAKVTKDARLLADAVRERIAPQICQALAGDTGDLYVLVLDPSVEKTFAQAFASQASAPGALEPRFADQILKRLAGSAEKMMAANLTPVLLCGAEMRRALREFTARTLPQLRVLAMTEVATNVKLKSFGVVVV